MFVWFGVFLLVVAAVCLAVGILLRKDESIAGGAFFGAIASGLLGLMAIIPLTFAQVEAGNVGVCKKFGYVKDGILSPGLHWPVDPFVDVHQMSVRTENYIMSATHEEHQRQSDDSIEALSSNGMMMRLEISIPYRLNEVHAPWVYKNLGPEYFERIFRPAARSATRRAVARFTDSECYSTKRDELATVMKTCFEEEIASIVREYSNPPENIVIISQVMINNISIPDTVRQAIEAKLKADQEQQAMDFQIQRERKEAERKKIEAEGIQQFQDIVSKGIDENLLKWKGIEATIELAKSQNAKIVVIGQGKDGLPLILGNADVSPKK